MELLHTLQQRPVAVGSTLQMVIQTPVEAVRSKTLKSTLMLSDLETEVRLELGEQRAGPVLSDTRRVLRELLMAERRVDEKTARAVLITEDLRGLLLRAEEFARLQARRAKRESGARKLQQADINRATRVAKVVAIVAPESVVRRNNRRPIALVVPPAWQPVLESVTGRSVAASAKRRHLELLITALARHGYLSPSELPTDADVVESFVVAEGAFKPKTICTALSDLRSALRQCIALGTLPPDTPMLGKRLGTKRIRGGKAWATNREAKLRAELPLWADDLEDYLTLSKDQLGGMSEQRRLATYRLAAGLCDMRDRGLLPGVDLRTLQMRDLGTLQISRPGGSTSRILSRAAERNGQRLTTDSVPLVTALGKYLTSSLRREKSGQGVPPIVHMDISRVWGMCTALLRPDSQAPLEERVIWQASDETVRKWTSDAEASRPASENERNKALLAEHLSLPQAIVFGIPYYTLIELPAADAELAAYPVGSPGRRAATERLARLLDEWIALATKIADPLRVEQRTFGRIGREIEVGATFDSKSGLLNSITGVTTHFAGKGTHGTLRFGEGNIRAGFKQHAKACRSWDWSPSIVDLKWLTRYFRELWFPRVQALGESGSMEDAMASGQWTLTPSTGAGGATSHPWKGMGGEWLSAKTGDAMLWVMRHALGHDHLPSLRQDAIRAGWSLLLSDHNVRHLWATYWGGIRASRGPQQVRADGTTVDSITGMDHCRRATTDTRKALEESYVTLTETMQRLQTRTVGSWAHPLSLDVLMDRVTVTDRTINWSDEWDRLSAIEGIDAMPPELRARWMQMRSTSSRVRARRGR